MNNFDYQMFLNGTNDGFNDMFLFNNDNMGNMNNNNNNNNSQAMPNGVDLYTPIEGYMKGNMFRDLYDPFRNYTPSKLTPRNAQEEVLLNLSQMHFAMHEANLYLDNFPNDRNMIQKFNEYRKAYDELLNEYQSKYGPLEINNPYMTNSPFAWTNDIWPWDRRNF